jgi:hypothetical protein
MATKKAYLSITIVLTIFVSITEIASTLTGFAYFGAAQAPEFPL